LQLNIAFKKYGGEIYIFLLELPGLVFEAIDTKKDAELEVLFTEYCLKYIP
jgi:hypothetical protein